MYVRMYVDKPMLVGYIFHYFTFVRVIPGSHMPATSSRMHSLRKAKS